MRGGGPVAILATVFRDAALFVGLVPVWARLPTLILGRVTVFAALRATEFACGRRSNGWFRLGWIVCLSGQRRPEASGQNYQGPQQQTSCAGDCPAVHGISLQFMSAALGSGTRSQKRTDVLLFGNIGQ